MKKNFRQFAMFLAMICIGNRICAQTTFEVPANYSLDTKSDYEKYEADIITAAKWLEENDLDKEQDKRKEVSSFVIKWILGSPSVTVDLSDRLSKLYGKNDFLLINYMAGYSAYCLQNKTTATKTLAAKAGLISMMNVYKKAIRIKDCKGMEKLIKLTEENKLDDYVAENFK